MPRTNNGEFVTEASKMFQAGDDCWHVGQYDEARKKYLYAADLYHKTGDTEGEAFVYSRLGELELSSDNYKEAEKALRQSTALVENYIDGQNTYGEALIKLSKVQTASGEDEKALQTIKKAQEVTAATDNKNCWRCL
ncbi:MAG: tetratricopeptide repeat protein [Alphaproteobacteria bacterium]